MTFATFATWIVAALLTGLAAGTLWKRGGPGMTPDLLLAVFGSGVACAAAVVIDLFPQPGVAATAIVALAGAGLTIAIQRRFFEASR